MSLRDYQSAAFDAAINWIKYKDTPAIVVIPTGGGKTFIISALVEHFYKLGQRVLLIAHRKELLQQSGNILTVPFGYYSASIGEKDLSQQVTVAGIQSIYDKETQPFDIIIIDETHRLPNSDEGMYWELIKKHPTAKVIGLSGTPFRLKGGKLEWGEIVYNIGYKELLDADYLSPVINKLKSAPDLSSVTITAGEYSLEQLEHIMKDGELVLEAAKNIKAYGENRQSVLIFCVGIKHCFLLRDIMASNGMEAHVLTGETPMEERDTIIEKFKKREIKYLINCMVLLEGFDAAIIDMLVCLRPTKSKGLWEQLVGRGVRKHPDKENCLLIDMSGNLLEHGGLGFPYREKGRREKAERAGRVCPVCETVVPPTSRECPDCGFIFVDPNPPKVKHQYEPDTSSDTVYSGGIEEYNVLAVTYHEHVSQKKGTKSLRVDYHCDTKYGKISEWLSPHNTSEYARGKAHLFFKERGWIAYGDIGKYEMKDLLFHAETLKKPSKITVNHSEKFPRIIKYEWASSPSMLVVGEGQDRMQLQQLLEDDMIPF